MSPVGPVLGCGFVADALVAALVELNPTATVEDRGAYRRVHGMGRCVLLRRAVEALLGHAIHLPSELEKTMCSYRGRMILTEDEVRWEA